IGRSGGSAAARAAAATPDQRHHPGALGRRAQGGRKNRSPQTRRRREGDEGGHEQAREETGGKTRIPKSEIRKGSWNSCRVFGKRAADRNAGKCSGPSRQASEATPLDRRPHGFGLRTSGFFRISDSECRI